MRIFVFSLLLLCIGCKASAQTYADSITAFRKQYAADLLAGSRSPIKHSQLGGLSFFHPDRSYCVWATVKLTPGSVPFLIQTHSGKQKPFREYGTLTFTVHDSTRVLHMYQSLDLVNSDAHKDDLFVPFTDLTNYESTYGGGRYIDLSVKDITGGQVLLDFNKCYNPYCAYADGYSCPIPPRENHLDIEIDAGEKSFIQ